MKRPILICVFFMCLVVASSHDAWARDAYSFKLDGESYRPTIVSLHGEPNKPQAGDLVKVGNILLTLGQEGSYDLRTTPKEDGRLLRITSKGTEVIGVGVNFHIHLRLATRPLRQWTRKARTQILTYFIESHARAELALRHRLGATLPLLEPVSTCSPGRQRTQ
jgi:hypothetical protein